jgi:hypothetical protein
MRDLAALFIHIIANIARLLGPSGPRAMVAESILVKRQLRAGSAIVIKPSIVLNSTCARIQHLFSPGGGRRFARSATTEMFRVF